MFNLFFIIILFTSTISFASSANTAELPSTQNKQLNVGDIIPHDHNLLNLYPAPATAEEDRIPYGKNIEKLPEKLQVIVIAVRNDRKQTYSRFLGQIAALRSDGNYMVIVSQDSKMRPSIVAPSEIALLPNIPEKLKYIKQSENKLAIPS